MTRKKINPKAVIADMRSGMDDNALMKQYELTHGQLQGLLRQMVVAGYLSSHELTEWMKVTQSQVFRALDEAQRAVEELD